MIRTVRSGLLKPTSSLADCRSALVTAILGKFPFVRLSSDSEVGRDRFGAQLTNDCARPPVTSSFDVDEVRLEDLSRRRPAGSDPHSSAVAKAEDSTACSSRLCFS